MLQHEGSSAPQDPHKSAAASSNPAAAAASVRSSSSSVTYVLDIKDIALQPNREVPLTLRKPEDRRRTTQIWQFKVCSALLQSSTLTLETSALSFSTVICSIHSSQ